MTKPNRADAENAFQGFLRSLGLDVENDPNLQDTAKRVTKMYSESLLSGLYCDPPKLTSFDLGDKIVGSNQIIISAPITLRSLCAHHFLPIYGYAFVAVLPEKGQKVLGLSKYARVVNHFASKPQTQEVLGVEICNYLKEEGGMKNVACIIKAKHMCMSHRGVCDNASYMITSCLNGKFFSGPIRSELYSLLDLNNVG